MSRSFRLNGAAVLEGTVALPRVGLWIADLDVDAPGLPLGSAQLALGDELTLTGCITAADVFDGRTRARVVAGAGGMARAVVARDYRLAPAYIPVGDVLAEAGEELSGTSDAVTLGRIFSSWTRTAGTVMEAFTALVAALGMSWRALPDGTIWIGSDTWPASAAKDVRVLHSDAREGRLVLASESLILPGTVLNGAKLSRVVLRISPEDVHTEAWTERESAAAARGDRLWEALATLIERVMRRVDFHALYGARVVAQRADGTVDLLPDDPRMPSKSAVPIRSMPGVRIKVAQGARVLLGFENGDPTKPIAALWESGGLVEIAFGGDRPVARMADQVLLTMPALTPVAGKLAGSDFVGVLSLDTPLIGQIITGSEKVKA